MFTRWWHFPLLGVLALGLIGAALGALGAVLIYPTLPSLEVLTDYRPKVPLRIYTADNVLIGEFGEERRALVKIENVPERMKQAILAAEDERFYEHGGVDYLGVARAAWANLTAGGAKEGASTITMQVARNFFLSREKTLTRKFSEVLLSLKIEHSLTKDQILELYINQIYLGQRAYGFAAAAQTYFGKSLDQLSIAETAMLAGLPKAPSRYNPVVNPSRAKARQRYVLRRMHELGYISDAQYKAAQEERLQVRRDQPIYPVEGDYVAEMVRQVMYERYQDEIYTSGMRVYTTIRSADQQAAGEAVRKGILAYDRRHGYRGPERRVSLPADGDIAATAEDMLQDINVVNGLIPAVVLSAKPAAVQVILKGGDALEIKGDGLKFVSRGLAPKAPEKLRISRGAVVRVAKTPKGDWEIVQLPEVEAAFVAMDPVDGAVRALVGGFDFSRNKFNHVTQALRQPGSAFKPFIYSAALERGFTPATIINDAPIVVDPADTGGKVWEPKNYDGGYDGPVRFRTALTKSKNLVSIRILQAIGVRYARDYVSRFGFDVDRQPPYLTMALGAGTVTPFELANGYTVFANGGYRIKPYYIDRIVDAEGRVVAQTRPVKAGGDAERAIDARNAFLMTSVMHDVMRFGTAARATQLGRSDLAGKTGTTNDAVDAWFSGYVPNRLVAVAWMGFDQPRSLGGRETGSQAALPMWISYMGRVLKGIPEQTQSPPDGVVALKINPASGLRDPDGVGTMVEYFYQENIPAEQPMTWGDSETQPTERPPEEIKDQLF